MSASESNEAPEVREDYEVPLNQTEPLETVIKMIENWENERGNTNYYAFQRDEIWYLGFGTQSTLTIDPTGQRAMVRTISYFETGQESVNILPDTNISELVRRFVRSHSRGIAGPFVHGFASYNFAAFLNHREFTPGEWPLLVITIPMFHVKIEQNEATVYNTYDDLAQDFRDWVESEFEQPDLLEPEVLHDNEPYMSNLRAAQNRMEDFSEVFRVNFSRDQNLDFNVDVPSTMYWIGELQTPRRTFAFKHNDLGATGFSNDVSATYTFQYPATELWAAFENALSVDDTELENQRREIVDTFENTPRELYQGTVFVLSHRRDPFFVAVRVKDGVYLDSERTWLQGQSIVGRHTNVNDAFRATKQSINEIQPFLVQKL